MSLVIGQFNDSFSPIMDGVANTVKNYAYWLNKKYGRCYVITPKFPEYIDAEKFSVLRYASTKLPTRPPYRLGLPNIDYKFKKEFKKNNFDLVHAHCPFSSGQLALKLARQKNIPIIATFHSKFYDDFKENLKSETLARLAVKKVIKFFEKVDYVWTVNNATSDTLRDYGYKGNFEIVENGTEFINTENIQNDYNFINEKYGFDEKQKVFLFVGQHIWQKNLKMLVNSLYHLKNNNVKFKMIFVGQGYAEPKIKEMVKKLKLEEDVIFAGLIIDRQMLKKYYIRADLFLFPSIYDNAPIVVREAAVAGCPSVLIKNCNASEGIRDNYNGYLSENDSIKYAEKIQDILSNLQNIKTVGETAKNTICKSWEDVVGEVYERYKEILDFNKKHII